MGTITGRIHKTYQPPWHDIPRREDPPLTLGQARVLNFIYQCNRLIGFRSRFLSTLHLNLRYKWSPNAWRQDFKLAMHGLRYGAGARKMREIVMRAR